MKNKIPAQLFLFSFLFIQSFLFAQKSKSFELSSPDGSLKVTVDAAEKLQWHLMRGAKTLIAPSSVSMQLEDGTVLGRQVKVISAKTIRVNNSFAPLHYKKSVIADLYNQLTLQCKGDYAIVFRAYDDGLAYRFITKRKDSLVITAEEANFNFADDYPAYIPYVNQPHNKDIYETSFENVYQHGPLSRIVKDTLAFAPVLVELPENEKIAVTEADLEDYPGMFLQVKEENGTQGKRSYGLQGKFAPYPTLEKQGGHNNLQSFVLERASFIARTEGTRNFPWRVVIISKEDKDLLNNDMIYKLAAPSRVKDPSWVKTGKVAWDWWNDWNITQVDFRAGINTATYKYYIDFAAANHIEYILLDEGWATSTDIMKIVPGVDLQEIIDYGKQKNVGIWLWGGWLPLDQKMDEALSTYSKMGIKGFKIDFMDRDDQKMVQFYYRLAAKAAEYKVMIDYHGAYKPTGLQRTFPNVVNFEGVHGMEQLKWSNPDMPLYDVTIPFIRMLAGPMDYTPGAMRNAGKQSFRAVNSSPMSQGTRCHQLAMYVIYEAPFEMLCDNPTSYMREPESLNFISSVPTVFDETVALDSKLASYAAIARRKNDTWYVGAIGNWEPRDITIDLSFLKDGGYEAEVFKDGLNADRDGTDYKREIIKVTGVTKLTIHLSNGGGWAAKIYPVK
ncbi:glycoside hydrolase family 97 protein [Flavitalea flava]